MFDQYPIVSHEGRDSHDLSDEVTYEKLIAWLEAKPDDFVLHGVSGRQYGGHPTGCLMEEYVNDLLGVTTFESGWDGGLIRSGVDHAAFTWRRSPVGARAIAQYDSLRASLYAKPVPKADVLAMLRRLQQEG